MSRRSKQKEEMIHEEKSDDRKVENLPGSEGKDADEELKGKSN